MKKCDKGVVYRAASDHQRIIRYEGRRLTEAKDVWRWNGSILDQTRSLEEVLDAIDQDLLRDDEGARLVHLKFLGTQATSYRCPRQTIVTQAYAFIRILPSFARVD